MTAFVQALTKAELKPVGNGMSLLSCGPDVRFPDEEAGMPATMLVRDFYPNLMMRLSTRRSWLLTGVPGTGKSWFAWYVMHCLLKQPQPPAIVWHAYQMRGACILFKGGKAYEGDISAFKRELKESTTWYVDEVDAMRLLLGEPACILVIRAVRVTTCCPLEFAGHTLRPFA